MFGKVTSKNAIVCTFPVFSSVLAKRTSAWDNHVLACNFAKYSPIKKKFTHRLSKKPFLYFGY